MKLPTPVQIETICTVDRLRTFTAAAAYLHTTQSAISARVREVEEMLGVILFKRNGRNVETTLDGRRFVEATAPLQQRLADFMGTFLEPHAISGRIRLAVGNSSMGRVSSMLSAIEKVLPNICFDLEVMYAAEILRDLEAGRTDIGVFHTPSRLDSKLFIHTSIGTEPTQWLMSSALRADFERRSPGFGLQTLLDHCQIWCVPKPAFYFDQAIESIASHGGKIRRLSTSGNMPATVDILLAHGGIGLITDHLSQAHCQNGSLVAAFDGISPPGFDYVLACARSRQSHLLGTVMEIATAAVHAGAAAPALRPVPAR